MHIIYITLTLLTIWNHGFAEVDLDPPQIQYVLNSILQTHHLPGIQVGIQDVETGNFWNFSIGYRDKETLEPLENHHLMQIGSITKSFIASLALLLEADSESGLIETNFNIEQTIGDWLPQYSEWQHIKIKNLLNMTSGIYNYTDENSLFLASLKDPKRVWQNCELVDFAYSKIPSTLFPLGTKYAYSNTNYILMGMILEKVSGLTLETLINERILKKYPDHFKHTTYSPKTYPQTEMQNMAHGYNMHPKMHPELYGKDLTAIGLSWAGAAGALTSTASDLANWPTLLFSEEFLPQKQHDELESLICIEDNCEGAFPLPKDSKLMGYGLGIARLYDPEYGYTWTHTGGTLGYHTVFIHLPQKGITISVIVNQIGPKIEDEQDVIFIARQIFNNLKFI